MPTEPFTADEYARIAEVLNALANLLGDGPALGTAVEYLRLAGKARQHAKTAPLL